MRSKFPALALVPRARPPEAALALPLMAAAVASEAVPPAGRRQRGGKSATRTEERDKSASKASRRRSAGCRDGAIATGRSSTRSAACWRRSTYSKAQQLRAVSSEQSAQRREGRRAHQDGVVATRRRRAGRLLLLGDLGGALGADFYVAPREASKPPLGRAPRGRWASVNSRWLARVQRARRAEFSRSMRATRLLQLGTHAAPQQAAGEVRVRGQGARLVDGARLPRRSGRVCAALVEARAAAMGAGRRDRRGEWAGARGKDPVAARAKWPTCRVCSRRTCCAGRARRARTPRSATGDGADAALASRRRRRRGRLREPR